MAEFVLFWMFCGLIMIVCNANMAQLIIGTTLFLIGGIAIRIIRRKHENIR